MNIFNNIVEAVGKARARVAQPTMMRDSHKNLIAEIRKVQDVRATSSAGPSVINEVCEMLCNTLKDNGEVAFVVIIQSLYDKDPGATNEVMIPVTSALGINNMIEMRKYLAS